MLLLTFSSLGNSVHLTPVIHTFVTSSMNPCNWSGIWNLWMDTEGDCWLFPWWNVLLAEYVWIQVPQKASTFSQYLFTALATIFKASKEISETAAYLWCALDHRFKKKKRENYSQCESDIWFCFALSAPLAKVILLWNALLEPDHVPEILQFSLCDWAGRIFFFFTICDTIQQLFLFMNPFLLSSPFLKIKNISWMLITQGMCKESHLGN